MVLSATMFGCAPSKQSGTRTPADPPADLAARGKYAEALDGFMRGIDAYERGSTDATSQELRELVSGLVEIAKKYPPAQRELDTKISQLMITVSGSNNVPLATVDVLMEVCSLSGRTAEILPLLNGLDRRNKEMARTRRLLTIKLLPWLYQHGLYQDIVNNGDLVTDDVRVRLDMAASLRRGALNQSAILYEALLSTGHEAGARELSESFRGPETCALLNAARQVRATTEVKRLEQLCSSPETR